MTSSSGVLRPALFGAAFLVAACGGGPNTPPTPSPTTLPPTPVLLSPINGAETTSDTPTFTVRNASGYDLGQANYSFRVYTRSGRIELASFAVAAGRGTTTAVPPSALPRGLALGWRAVATHFDGQENPSELGNFRLPPVTCEAGAGPYAKRVVDWHLPECSLQHNKFNDPNKVLGRPDAGGHDENSYHGFMSLGDDGYVTVDMESCMVDRPGPDFRIFQAVSDEEVTVYVAGQPAGPFVLLKERKPCGNSHLEGVFSGFCNIDLAESEVDEARYVKIEDGEQFPCPGGTRTEGADIDAVEILNQKP